MCKIMDRIQERFHFPKRLQEAGENFEYTTASSDERANKRDNTQTRGIHLAAHLGAAIGAAAINGPIDEQDYQ